MKRLLLGLLAATLLPLGLSANTPIEPDAYYRATLVADRPATANDAGWKIFADNVNNADKGSGAMRVSGNTLSLNFPRIRGNDLTRELGKSFSGLVFRIASAEKLPPTPEELERARQKAAENDPRGPVDAKGKPIYNAGSREAQAQERASAREQDRAANKFKQTGGWGNGPVTGKGLTGQDVKNTGAFDESDAGPAPAAPTPGSGSTFAQRKQGTKKDDTLFKNQNQNSPEGFRAPDNFMGIWAHPDDKGGSNEDSRLVLVRLADTDKPVGLTLWQAKQRGYVPKSTRYSSLPVY